MDILPPYFIKQLKNIRRLAMFSYGAPQAIILLYIFQLGAAYVTGTLFESGHLKTFVRS